MVVVLIIAAALAILAECKLQATAVVRYAVIAMARVSLARLIPAAQVIHDHNMVVNFVPEP